MERANKRKHEWTLNSFFAHPGSNEAVTGKALLKPSAQRAGVGNE